MLYTALNAKYDIECIEQNQVTLFNLLPLMSQHMILIAVKLHINSKYESYKICLFWLCWHECIFFTLKKGTLKI